MAQHFSVTDIMRIKLERESKCTARVTVSIANPRLMAGFPSCQAATDRVMDVFCLKDRNMYMMLGIYINARSRGTRCACPAYEHNK